MKGTPYFIREEHNITEEDIDNDFLAEYDRLGFLNIADTQVRIYFGIDDNPKIWNQNPFLSHIIGETAYSAVIVFIDEAEFTEGMTKLSNDELRLLLPSLSIMSIKKLFLMKVEKILKNLHLNLVSLNLNCIIQ